MHPLQKKLDVYRERLKSVPPFDEEWLKFYESEIESMENEIEAEEAIDGLMEEINPPQLWTVKTDSWETVRDLFKTTTVVEFDQRWSWRKFKNMFYISYYTR